MHRTMRRLAVALAAAGLLAAVGCAKDESVSTSETTAPVTAASSNDDGTTSTTEDDEDEDPDADEDKGSGAYAEVCEKLEELDALSDDTPDDEAFALMEEARDAGPDELADHWDTLIGVLEELMALDEDSDEAFGKALELMEDQDFLEAAAAIDDFAEEECGLDIDLDPAEESDSPGGLSDDEDSTSSSSSDDDPTSIDAVQAHLESRFGAESWYEVLDSNVTWGSSGMAGTVTWTIGLGDDPASAGATTTELVDVCEVLASYLDTYESDEVTIEISGPDEAIIVSRQPGEECEAA